jgi:hypothetical protein
MSMIRVELKKYKSIGKITHKLQLENQETYNNCMIMDSISTVSIHQHTHNISPKSSQCSM